MFRRIPEVIRNARQLGRTRIAADALQRFSMLDRRSFLSLGAVSALATAGAGAWAAQSNLIASTGGPDGTIDRPLALRPVPTRADRIAYEAFRSRFVSPDGRVIDNYNGNVSHSEGQGWGMLMAVAFDDRATFDRLHAWTRRWLRRPGDHLHAWRYQPNADRPVADLNNASDGDLYIAGALARAGRAWRRPELSAEAANIASDIMRHLVRRVGRWTVLLPGVYGFEKEGGTIVNPSYYAFPLIREMAALVPSPLWAKLQRDGLQLIDEGRFGTWNLPPDWLRVDRNTGALSPAEEWPARFSYDAIRIPLNLAWSGLHLPGLSQAFSRYWTAPHPFKPAWADLRNGSIAPYPAEAGTQAVARIMLQSGRSAVPPSGHEAVPQVDPTADYYSSALIVLSRLAAGEGRSTI